MDDPVLLVKFDAIVKEHTTPVEQIKLTWDDYPVYRGDCSFDQIEQCAPTMPLVADANGMFGLSGAFPEELFNRQDKAAQQQLLYVAFNSHGGPAGTPEPLALPKLNDDLIVTGAICHGGNLYVSTQRTGLLIYQPSANQWKQITPKDGLPDWYVDRVHPLDDHTLLVVTGSPEGSRIDFNSLDIDKNELKLLTRSENHPSNMAQPIAVWHSGDGCLGIARVGLIRDILGKPQFQLYWPSLPIDGWPHTFEEFTSAATVNGKLYVMSWDGLHEITDDGKVVRTWWSRQSLAGSTKRGDTLSRDTFVTPGDFPSNGRHAEPSHGLQRTYIASSKNHLFLVNQVEGILCYEPATDTWFGPLQPCTRFPHAVAAGHRRRSMGRQ